MKKKILILILQLASHGADAYFTHRNQFEEHGRELNPIMRPFMKNDATLIAGFSLGLGTSFEISHQLRKHKHPKVARAFEISEIGLETESAVFTATHGN